MRKSLVRLVLLAISALFLGTAFAEPDLLLYFQIDDSAGTWPEYDFMTVVLADGSGNPTGSYLYLYADGATTPMGQALSSDSTEPVYAALGSGSSAETQILFELWANSGNGYERVAYHDKLRSELSAHIVNEYGQVTPYVITSVTPAAIPEPTSGLLLLVGGALLALRRKGRARYP